jgi:two-component system response regulator RegA
MNTVLVVEDDEVHRDALARTLRRSGFAVLTAAGLTQAEASVKNRIPDAAIVDLRLGDGDGIEVVQMLNLKAPKCRTIVLTGFGSIPSAVDAVKSGAVDFRTKPTTPEDIVAAVRRALSAPAPPTELDEVERQHIMKTLEGTDGNISHAARRLGLHRRTLQRKLQRLDGSEGVEGEDDGGEEDSE